MSRRLRRGLAGALVGCALAGPQWAWSADPVPASPAAMTGVAAQEATAGWVGKANGAAFRRRGETQVALEAKHYLEEIQCGDEFRCAPGGALEILRLNGTKERWTNAEWTRVQPLPPVALVGRYQDLATPTAACARLVRDRAGGDGIRRPFPRTRALEALDTLSLHWQAGAPGARVRIVIIDDGGGELIRHDGRPNTGRYELSAADRAALRAELGRPLELKLTLQAAGAPVETMTTTFELRDPLRVAALQAELAAPVPGWPAELVDAIRAARLVRAGLLPEARTYLLCALRTEDGRRSAAVRELLERVEAALAGTEAGPPP